MFKAPLNILTLLAVAGLGASAMPAMAKPSGASEPSVRMSVKEKDGKTIYCVHQAPKTGSFVGADVCKTREEWAQAGLNIPADTRSAETKSTQPAGS